jgi:hypothetical protein
MNKNNEGEKLKKEEQCHTYHFNINDTHFLESFLLSLLESRQEHSPKEIYIHWYESPYKNFFEKYSSEGAILRTLSKYLGIPYMDPREMEPSLTYSDIVSTIPQKIMEKHRVVPLKKTGNELWLAMANPFDLVAIDKIREITGCQIKPIIAEERLIKELLGKFKYLKKYQIAMEDWRSLEEKAECYKPKHNILYRKAKLVVNIVRASFISPLSGKDVYIDKETGDILSYEEIKDNG